MAIDLKTLCFDIDSLHEVFAAGVTAEAMLTEVLRRIAVTADPGIFLHLANYETLAANARQLGVFDPVAKVS